jgi:hypothetical protein
VCRVNSLAALSKCTKLKYLDMALVSENIPLARIFHAVKPLGSLRYLVFPRSSPQERDFNADLATWPCNLRSLSLIEGVSPSLYEDPGDVPKTLTQLTLHSRDTTTLGYRTKLMQRLGSQLTRLTLGPAFDMINGEFRLSIFTLCPHLIFLRIGYQLLGCEHETPLDGEDGLDPYPLQTLIIDATPPHSEDIYGDWDQLVDDLTHDVSIGRLRNVRKIHVSNRLTLGSTSRHLRGLRKLDRTMRWLDIRRRLGVPYDRKAVSRWLMKYEDTYSAEYEDDEDGDDDESEAAEDADAEAQSSDEESDDDELLHPGLANVGVFVFDDPE